MAAAGGGCVGLGEVVEKGGVGGERWKVLHSFVYVYNLLDWFRVKMRR